MGLLNFLKEFHRELPAVWIGLKWGTCMLAVYAAVVGLIYFFFGQAAATFWGEQIFLWGFLAFAAWGFVMKALNS